MAETDPRIQLQRAQIALGRGELRDAESLFRQSAHGFAGPAQLLGAGHGWRGQAQVAIRMGALQQARSALESAWNLYHAGSMLLADVTEPAFEPVKLDLLEGKATARVMDADALLRLGRFREARARIDEAYPLYTRLEERPSVSDLWTVTARLAEREGRWFSARTAWEQVLRSRQANHDEAGQCDAAIRLAEAMLGDGDTAQAEDRLDEAERLAREIGDPALTGRVHIARARSLELTQDWPGAWEKWLDALEQLQRADPVLRGLARVRMARTAAKLRPADAEALLEDGLHDLFDGEYPDAIALVLHQLAVVALIRGEPKLGALAAVGAERARGGWDPSLHGLLFRALLNTGARKAALLLGHRHPSELPLELLADVELAPTLDLDDGEAVGELYWEEIRQHLGPSLQREGLEFSELGSRRMAMKLIAGFTTQPEFDTGQEVLELVWQLREGEYLRQPLLGIVLIGRGASNGIRMSWDGLASRSHSVIEQRDDGVYVRDLNSQHGTLLDGQKLTAERRLEPGQTLQIGETTFQVEVRVTTTSSVAMVAIPAS